MLVNIGLFYYLRNLKGHRKLYASKALIFALSAIALFLFLNIMAYAPCQEHSSASAAARVAVVQPNIPQDKKWDASFREHILSTLDTLTRAAAVKKADCIIWPEAALPGFLEYDEGVTDFFYSLVADIKVPLLAGMATFSREGARTLYFNSALLFSEGRYCGKYDKIHLVPFGEYIPFASLLPWLERLPRFNEIGNFSPGSEYTVFSVPCGGTAIRVSVLICFEDTVPCLSRTYARKGAQLIAVMTNDAWFKDTAAPFQHAQASVLRAVENGVWVARAANTGFSCIIGPDGKIRDYVRDSRGKAVFTQGSTAYDIPLNAPKATFYRMCGDWFILLLACGAGLLFLRDRNSF